MELIGVMVVRHSLEWRPMWWHVQHLRPAMVRPLLSVTGALGFRAGTVAAAAAPVIPL